MDGTGAFWTYEESLDDVKEKLLITTIELERVKMESQERMRKHGEDVKQLIYLLNTAYKERDELESILKKIISSNSPESPILFPNKANSSITESNSHNFFQTNTRVSPNFNEFHPVSNVKMDPIMKVKKLPEKGKLVEAMTKAPPLLQTLLLAGPLPQWRNPPSLKIPPVSMTGWV